MVTVSIFMFYALMIAIFDAEVGILFGTIGLALVIVVGKLFELLGLDKKFDEWF